MKFEDAIKEYKESQKDGVTNLGISNIFMLQERHTYITIEQDGSMVLRFLESQRTVYEDRPFVAYHIGNRHTAYIPKVGDELRDDWYVYTFVTKEVWRQHYEKD